MFRPRNQPQRRIAGAARKALLPCLLVALIIVGEARGATVTQHTTTTYHYNADGALTAVTTKVDDQAAATTYLTWDNFVPNVADPTTGAVRAANGNLTGFGPIPGSGYTKQFQFDQRNRLTSAAATSAQSATYAYHPASLMASSTLASGDALQFYYDTASMPQAVNIQQPATATWSSYLGDMTYLSDGTEQMRCQPRKDVAGVYLPAQQTFSPNRYEPYGASASGNSGPANSASYDMTANPFQFAGEYRDPTSGLYYLRARWYLPEFQTFTARDPVDGVHRYSYSGGNPVGNVDPSGLSYASFSRDINRAFHPLTRRMLGYVVPLVPILGQVVGGMTLLANLPEVWHHPTGRTWLNFGFLTSSVVIEAVGELPVFDRLAGSEAAFYGRTLVDQAVGGGQAVLTSYHHGKWDVPALVQSIEYNVGGMFTARSLAGIGYRPQAYTAEEVSEFAKRYHENGQNSGRALVFRVRMRLAGSAWIPTFTSPLLEEHTLGFYHEGVLAIGPKGYVETDIAYREFQTGHGETVRTVSSALYSQQFKNGATFATTWKPTGINIERGFTYVGSFDKASTESVLRAQEPYLYPTHQQQAAAVLGGKAKPTGYLFFSNNCHDYATRMIGRMQR